MFEIKFNKVILWLLPILQRTSFNIAWLKSLINPLILLQNDLSKFKTDTLDKLKYNGQVCYLEAVLNNKLDAADRGIWIEDAGGKEVVLIHSDLGDQPLKLQNDANADLTIYRDSAYSGGSYDFIVNTPYKFEDAKEFQLKALTNYYKLAGKRFDVAVKPKQNG